MGLPRTSLSDFPSAGRHSLARRRNVRGVRNAAHALDRAAAAVLDLFGVGDCRKLEEHHRSEGTVVGCSQSGPRVPSRKRNFRPNHCKLKTSNFCPREAASVLNELLRISSGTGNSTTLTGKAKRRIPRPGTE